MSEIYFKWCHKQYLVEHTPTPLYTNQYTIWARSVEDNKEYFLGSIVDGEIREYPKYVNYAWDVQRGAERLYKLLWKYKHRFETVGYCDIIPRMKHQTKVERNKDLVEKRLSNPKKWTWGRLGETYNIDRYTARDIFQRDMEKYGSQELINAYKQGYILTAQKSVGFSTANA